jgi:hypothetical protein
MIRGFARIIRHARADIRCLPLVLAASACSGRGADATAAGTAPGLAGTWRAIEYSNPRARDSAARFPFGRPPRGYLVYDATGHVFFQAIRGVAASGEARGRWHTADSLALNRLLSDAAAYFGSYRVDHELSTVVHHIEGEIPPNSGLTEVATPFRIRGDTLILGQDSSAHWMFVRAR